MTKAHVDKGSPLAVFRDPEAVTVVGASADPAKWGYWLARGALKGAHRRRVYLVNARGTEIEGQRSYRSVQELPDAPGLVVLCVPAAAVPQVVTEALAKGARGFLGITAGIDRVLGREGAERDLARQIRAHGARMVGPNCLGIYDASTDLQLAWGEFSPGSLGIVSQSGQLGSELANLAADCGLGVSRFVSVGNQVDVTAEEALADLLHHEATRVVALYLESFADGRRMIATLRALRAAGKHTILLTVGASEASWRAAQSHTGALTSALDVVDAACRAAGVIRVDTPAQLVDVAQLVLSAPLPAGPRVAVVGDSGGQGAVAADLAGGHGLRVEQLAEASRQRLAEMLPPDAGLSNPIDLAGAGEQDLTTYARVVDTLLADPAVDAVTLTGYFGSYGADTPSIAGREQEVARSVAEAARRHRKPVVLHSMCRQSETIDLLRRLGVPAYHTVEAATASLASATRLVAQPGRELATPPRRAWPHALDGYLAARKLLAEVGVRFPPAIAVSTTSEVVAAAGQLRAPYVLKADWVAHKTEVGGVVLGLADADTAAKAFEEMSARLGPGRYVLEELDRRTDTVEMIVGARRDSTFGPLVMVGAGGVQAELFRDVAWELAPVDPDTAAAMLQRLRSHALLTGWRGRPAVDVAELIRTVVAVSTLICELPECDELELNPVRVGPDGVVAVDALVIRGSPHDSQEDR